MRHISEASGKDEFIYVGTQMLFLRKGNKYVVVAIRSYRPEVEGRTVHLKDVALYSLLSQNTRCVMDSEIKVCPFWHSDMFI